jgi:hypothetical protein
LGNLIVLGLDLFPGFRLIAGQQAFLLAAGAVFALEDLSASEHCESVLHSCLSGCEHELKTVKQEWNPFAEWCGGLGNFRKASGLLTLLLTVERFSPF